MVNGSEISDKMRKIEKIGSKIGMERKATDIPAERKEAKVKEKK